MRDPPGEQKQVTEEWAGTRIERPLIENGCSIPVTNKNRDKYIHLYTEYSLKTSISTQFEAFSRGFYKVRLGFFKNNDDLQIVNTIIIHVDAVLSLARRMIESPFGALLSSRQVYAGNALKLFKPEELELLVCGLPHLDFEALEAVTKYEGGYTESHVVVRYFWEAIHAMNIKEKKKFLFFSTGCDRAPLDGLGSMRFVIQKGGADSDRLPVAHTCFNTLILPEYSSRGKLQKKLMTAIENSEGFGLQ